MRALRKFRSFLPALALFATLNVFAQDKAPSGQHPGFTGRLAQPSIIFGLRKNLELTGKQIDAIRWTHDKQKTESEAAEREVKKRAEALHGYLQNDEIDSTEAARFLDRLTKAENAAKKIHISILIEVDNVLTSEQRSKLKKLRESGEITRMIERGQGLQQRLQPKVARFQKNMQVYEDLGGAPYEIVQLAEKIRNAMENKDYEAAEKLLDKALKASEEDK